MSVKTIITVLLLAFVGASGVYLAVNEGKAGQETEPSAAEGNPGSQVQGEAPAATGGGSSTGDPAPMVRSNPDPGAAEAGAGAPDATDAAAGRKVLVYYFHATRRCRTCLAIESQAREAVEQAFAHELEAGLVEWRTVNIDEEANQHYVTDFGLSFSSVVVVEMNGDERGRWQNLQDVWQLVHGGREPYDSYVQKAVIEYLGG